MIDRGDHEHVDAREKKLWSAATQESDGRPFVLGSQVTLVRGRSLPRDVQTPSSLGQLCRRSQKCLNPLGGNKQTQVAESNRQRPRVGRQRSGLHVTSVGYDPF